MAALYTICNLDSLDIKCNYYCLPSSFVLHPIFYEARLHNFSLVPSHRSTFSRYSSSSAWLLFLLRLALFYLHLIRSSLQ